MSGDLHVPAPRDLPPGRAQARKEHLVAEVARSLGAAQRRQRRRVVVGVLVPAVALLLAGVGVSAYLLTRPATQLDGIGCYRSASLEADTAVVSADGRNPVSACADVWRSAFGTPPPSLRACVLESGAVGVFPGANAETCRRLGLAELASGYEAEARRFAKLRDALVTRFGAACVGEGEARRIVRDQLADRGFDDWKIEEGAGIAGEGFSADRPCAGLAFDGERQVIMLVPEPRR
jgi:hypothetical protein